MKIHEIAQALSLECLQPKCVDCDIKAIYTSDLLSDVLANAEENSVLVTIQAHKNTVAVATIKSCPAIIICNNRLVPPEMIQAAAAENIGIFSTVQSQFAVSGLLYTILFKTG